GLAEATFSHRNILINFEYSWLSRTAPKIIQLIKVLHFPAPFWLISEFNSRHHKAKPDLSQ
ncbi:hypothetical protein, partial [Eikenella corrodens]|uniref:hypothetical protein n=1 Tax=Eikenella corrodens TaxID=539 RepID=UPI001959EC90